VTGERRTGWSASTVTVGPRVPRRQEAEARYRDGSGIVRCRGRQMVVSFADDGPHHVPASATGPRVQPMSPVR
jgi:hypothetical protein